MPKSPGLDTESVEGEQWEGDKQEIQLRLNRENFFLDLPKRIVDQLGFRVIPLSDMKTDLEVAGDRGKRILDAVDRLPRISETQIQAIQYVRGVTLPEGADYRVIVNSASTALPRKRGQKRPFEDIPSDGANPSLDGSTAGILRCQTIEQTSEKILFDVTPLLQLRPTDEDWVPCVVSVNKFSTNPWIYVKDLPGIHQVGLAGGEEFEVAIRESYMSWLKEYGFEFEQLQVGGSQWYAMDTQLQEEAAKHRLLRRAVLGLSHGLGRGLDRYYRHRMAYNGLLPAIEWAILIRDIVTSDRQILCRFLLRCIFFGLYPLRDYNSTPVQKIIDRDEKTWVQHFRQLGHQKCEWPSVGNSPAELHTVALLWTVFESVGGQQDVGRHHFDMTWSASKSFAAFGEILGLDADHAEPASFRKFDTTRMKATLLRSRVFGNAFPGFETLAEVELLPDERLLGDIMPGVVEVRDVLPTELVYNIEDGKLAEIRAMRSVLHHEVPSLNDDCGLDMLVCSTARYPTVEPYLRNWLLSQDGQDFYQGSLARMLESRSPERKVLALTALLWRSRILHLGSGMRSGPTYGAYLLDFNRLLHGLEGLNQQQVLERMALSAQRVVRCHPSAYYWLDNAVQGSELLPDMMDGLSDKYWSYMMGSLQHLDAYEKTRQEFNRRMQDIGGETDGDYVVIGEEEDGDAATTTTTWGPFWTN